MRYYAIKIIDPDTGKILVPDPKTRIFTPTAPGANVSSYASHSGDTFYPGALDLELDLQITGFAEVGAKTGCALKIWGISLAEIGQRAKLNGKLIEIYGGFKKGLPLVKPQQAGLLLHGLIFQAFGNWQGTEQTLDFIIYPDSGTRESPANIVFDCPAGTSLASAVETTLARAFPRYTRSIHIDPRLVLDHTETHVVASLSEFAYYIFNLSQHIIQDSGYAGVNMRLNTTEIFVYDRSTKSKPIKIAFEDMIGQPTWVDVAKINISLAMRADISVMDVIQLPPGLLGGAYVLTTPGAAKPESPATARNYNNFTGAFNVVAVHHFGHYRQPDANSWVTVIDANPLDFDPPRGLT